MLIKRIYVIFAVIITAALAAAAAGHVIGDVQTVSTGQRIIVVDPGHGSPDGGAVGVNGTIEKDVNLAIALKLQEILEEQGVKVILTREDDSGLQDDSADTIREMKVSDMHKRKKIMEDSDAELFLSIHMNSLPNSSAHGLRVFYDSAHPEKEELAKKLQQSISDVTGAQGYAVKAADKRLFLMKDPPVPSILIECGFLSNAEEEKKLNDETYRAKIAWGIAEAVF